VSQRDNEQFFSDIKELVEFREVADPKHYVDVPESWLMVLTDVEGSTRAIEAGRYKDVNALGVASIAAVQNAMPELEVPFVFGGDGATLAVPGSKRAGVEAALRGARELAQTAFGMRLRVGVIGVRALLDAGHKVRVARYRSSEHVALALFAGDGVTEAEAWLKAPPPGIDCSVPEDGPTVMDFEGFECRWRPVRSQRGQVASVLVTALVNDEAERAAVYRRVIERLDDITRRSAICPVSLKSLKMNRRSDEHSVEAKVLSGHPDGPEYERRRKHAQSKTRIARALMLLGGSAGGFDGAAYKRELVANTDFRKFDETLRMVVDLEQREVDALRAFLAEQRAKGLLAYGVHCAPAALVTCIVRSYSGNHLHFVDGADGGYALAAKELKSQLRSVGLPSMIPGFERR
jgi:hypothetical protein